MNQDTREFAATVTHRAGTSSARASWLKWKARLAAADDAEAAKRRAGCAPSATTTRRTLTPAEAQQRLDRLAVVLARPAVKPRLRIIPGRYIRL